MLTFPVLFQSAGIVTGIGVLLVSCIVSYKTCRIYVMHLAPEDNDVEDTIRRIMGVRWERAFRLVTGFYLVLLNIIYIFREANREARVGLLTWLALLWGILGTCI